MQKSYEKPVVEIVDAEQLIESVGAQAATTVSNPTGGNEMIY